MAKAQTNSPWLIFRIALVLALFAAFLPARHLYGNPSGDWDGKGETGCSMMHRE